MKKLWQALILVHRCDRGSFWRRVFYVLLQSLLPLVNLYLLKLLIDAVATSLPAVHYREPLLYLLAMTAVFLLNRVVAALDRVNNDVLAQRLTDYMSDIMQHQAARLDLAYYDTPAYHDTLHRAQQEAGARPIAILNNFMAVGGAVVSILGVTAILVTASWWVVPVMLLAVLPSFAVRLHKARSIYRFRRENTQHYRRTAYYAHLLTSREAAAEMRVYRLAPLFRRRFVAVRQILVKRLLTISRRLGAADILCAVIEAVAMFAVVGLFAMRTFQGAVTVGSFVMFFEAFRRGQGYLTSLVSGIAGLYDNRLFVSNLFEFLQLQPTLESDGTPVAVPERIDSVEFRDITFRYPGMQHDVLTHYNLVARVGEITRISGCNGYGKSTLVKLLLRLYDPQQGAVMVNGIDIRRFQPEEWRGRAGVLFQDFVRYFCTLRENVNFGDVMHPDAPVDTALAVAGVADLAARMPEGLDSQLGRMFDGGAELSMGQWQRLAIARALQSDAPLLLLDEPMAWLDTDARQQLADRLEKMKENKIIILITHT